MEVPTLVGIFCIFNEIIIHGVFGNEVSWILDAFRISVEKFRNVPLDVRIVSYGNTDPKVANFIECYNCFQPRANPFANISYSFSFKSCAN
ncbi:hypothetical protein [Epilithonimonas vandammei]|uniref:hypothetical protein n=1 Tax=Epilithonimonas vandammei TaxID=2487072 RepID=UPI0028A008EF|nr:hypothetical protein [Epilithonimonas vandammei]